MGLEPYAKLLQQVDPTDLPKSMSAMPQNCKKVLSEFVQNMNSFEIAHLRTTFLGRARRNRDSLMDSRSCRHCNGGPPSPPWTLLWPWIPHPWPWTPPDMTGSCDGWHVTLSCERALTKRTCLPPAQIFSFVSFQLSATNWTEICCPSSSSASISLLTKVSHLVVFVCFNCCIPVKIFGVKQLSAVPLIGICQHRLPLLVPIACSVVSQIKASGERSVYTHSTSLACWSLDLLSRSGILTFLPVLVLVLASSVSSQFSVLSTRPITLCSCVAGLASRCLAILQNLVSVPRFEMVTMFMSASDVRGQYKPYWVNLVSSEALEVSLLCPLVCCFFTVHSQNGYMCWTDAVFLCGEKDIFPLCQPTAKATFPLCFSSPFCQLLFQSWTQYWIGWRSGAAAAIWTKTSRDWGKPTRSTKLRGYAPGHTSGSRAELTSRVENEFFYFDICSWVQRTQVICVLGTLIRQTLFQGIIKCCQAEMFCVLLVRSTVALLFSPEQEILNVVLQNMEQTGQIPATKCFLCLNMTIYSCLLELDYEESCVWYDRRDRIKEDEMKIFLVLFVKNHFCKSSFSKNSYHNVANGFFQLVTTNIPTNTDIHTLLAVGLLVLDNLKTDKGAYQRRGALQMHLIDRWVVLRRWKRGGLSTTTTEGDRNRPLCLAELTACGF